MEMYDYLKFIAALLFVLGLMGGLALFLKRIGLGGPSMMAANKRRLKIIEILHIDARRKAVLMTCDDQEHLVILGVNGETVIESNIKSRNQS